MNAQGMALMTPLSRPGDPTYAAATRTFNLTARVQPALATVVRSVPDVVGAVTEARRIGMPIRVTSTGHGANAQPPPDGALLLRTEMAGGVRVNPGTRTAIVPSGATWSDVVTAAAAHRLVAAHGSSGTVGVVGYLLRGGISFYGRRFGLAVNSLRSVTLVLADGSVTVANDDHDPDLFWALRGGGGGFGIVTEVEIYLHPMSAIITGATIWDAADADVIVPLWARWTHDAPAEVSTSLRLMNLPPLPGVPDMLTTGQILVVDGAVGAEASDDLPKAESFANDLLAPLRARATPIMDTWHAAGPVDLLQTHMDPPDPLPYAGNHILLHDLDEDGIEQFLRSAGPASGPPLMIAELRQLGGAFATPSRAGGAFDRTAAHYAHVAIGVVIPPQTPASVGVNIGRVATALAPWDTGLTIPSVVENHAAVQRTFDDQTAAAADAVRRRVDPRGMFRHDVDPVRDRGIPVPAIP